MNGYKDTKLIYFYRLGYDSFGNTVYVQDGTRYEEIRFTGREYFPEVGRFVAAMFR